VIATCGGKPRREERRREKARVLRDAPRVWSRVNLRSVFFIDRGGAPGAWKDGVAVGAFLSWGESESLVEPLVVPVLEDVAGGRDGKVASRNSCHTKLGGVVMAVRRMKWRTGRKEMVYGAWKGGGC
jgi:hypothetical protein